MKKILSLIMALLLVASIAVAVAEEPVTITWLMRGDNNVAENTEMEQYLEDKFNIDLQITYISQSDYDTKLNTLIAAGTLPEETAVTAPVTEYTQYGTVKMSIPLEEFRSSGIISAGNNL